MTMFRDRVSGAAVDVPPSPAHLGRWQVVDDDGAIYINGCQAVSGDVLAPGATEHWALERPGDTTPVRGRFFAEAAPNEQDVTALLQLGCLLRNPEKIAEGWLGWSGTSPLAPSLDKAVEPHPLEEHIEAEFRYLAEVCRNPRTHIRIEAERVLVSRARRIDLRAPAWLASHTEDWEHRRIADVQPRRILAEVREEQWDLYENRVAVRLVDNLVTWLRRRIAEVRRVLKDIFTRLEQFAVATVGNRHRMERIYRLWGEAWDVSHGREAAERTLERLERLLYQVLGLMDSPLYRNVSPRAQVPRALRMTNLLSNDDNYRGVSRLWHHWSRLGVPHSLAGPELYDRHQRLHQAYVAWCMLVIVRACTQLRLEPIDDAGLEVPLQPGFSVNLDGGVRLDWSTDGVMVLSRGQDVLARLVPLVHAIEHATAPDALKARLAPLAEAVANSDTWTIILHPAVPGTSAHETLAAVDIPPVQGTRGAIDFIRVSPFSLDSVERVARAIRWTVLAPQFLAYPPTLPAAPELPDTKEATWHRDQDRSTWVLVRPLRPDEESRLDLSGHLNKACAKRDRLVAEREDLLKQLKSARGNRRRMAELNRRKTALRQPLHQAEECVKTLEAFAVAFRTAHSLVIALSECPICGSEAVFEPRNEGCFAGSCSSDSCAATWELRYDREAGVRIPILLPGGTDTDKWPKNAPPQWVDGVLGCDVLAIPFVQTPGAMSFLAPRRGPFGDRLNELCGSVIES